jgi:hypothetical protein
MDTSHKDTTETEPKDSKIVTTILRDSLGSVSFSIPARFDTSFTWTNHSDCGKPCDHEEYRFQPKTLPVFKESGFYYDIPDISIDQFTIIHSGYFPFHNGDTSKNFVRHENFKSQLLSKSNNSKLVSDTLEKIYDRYFSIVGITGFDTTKQKHFARLAGLTTINGNEIEFEYDIKTKGTINEKQFFENATKFIRTIRIRNGI